MVDHIRYRFGEYEVDPACFELRKGDIPVPIEPQVFSTLLLLVSNNDRLVSRDEIVEKVWNGRIVSEAAISARIKSARQAIGDDGTRQDLIKTVHGKGFRFVGQLEFEKEAVPAQVLEPASPGARDAPLDTRPTLAVLPFEYRGADERYAFLGRAFGEELLSDLARLRWISVIGRGSSFRFRNDDADPVKVGTALGARYCVSGTVSARKDSMRFSVELSETTEGTVVWSESYQASLEELEEARENVVEAVVSAIDHEIPIHEAKAVRGRPLFSLDAWSLYYLGYDSLMRFNSADNAYAITLLERARELDENFSRCFSGLSFAHHQNHFMQYTSGSGQEIEMARQLAQRALELDRNDPFAHFNMARANWVNGGMEESIEWLDHTTRLSPSYAHGVYAKAWTQTLTNDLEGGEQNAREALRLSPLDPLRYAMLATLALSRLGQGDAIGAADLAQRGARTPGAHKHISLIAAVSTQAAGDRQGAERWVEHARSQDQSVNAAAFLNSFPMLDGELRNDVTLRFAELGLV